MNDLTTIFVTMTVVALQAVLIALLLVQRHQRRRAEERNRAILRALPDLMFVMGRDGRYVDYHARDGNQLLVPASQFLGRHVREVLPPDLARRVMLGIEETLATGEPSVVEYSLPIGGEERNYEARIIGCDDGKTVSIVRDMTAQKRTDEALLRNTVALRQSHLHARDLAGRLIASQEDERARIARDLHDDLSQKLALLSMDIEQLSRLARSPQGISVGDAIKRQVDDIATDIHRLSYELHPSKLHTIGLVPAIASCCRDVSSRHNLAVSFNHAQVPENVPRDLSLCTYRIVQEALHNVVRHSGANAAQVYLSAKSGYLELEISDRGRGFVFQVDHSGLGLLSMRERVHHLAGHISVQTSPGAGTRISVRLPMTPAEVRGAQIA